MCVCALLICHGLAASLLHIFILGSSLKEKPYETSLIAEEEIGATLWLLGFSSEVADLISSRMPLDTAHPVPQYEAKGAEM